MPRILYIILFIFLTLVPFTAVKVLELFLGVTKEPTKTTTTNTGHNNGYYGDHYYHRPYYGGFFYYGNRGRGGWMGRSYRSYGGSSSWSRSSGGRSYSGGSSSYRGGSFGSFGK